MVLFKECTNCGRKLEFKDMDAYRYCPGCRTLNERPQMDAVVLSDFRRAIELQNRQAFSEAQASYDLVLNAHPDNAEALWGRLLCHYGASLYTDSRNSYERKWEIRITRDTMLRTHGDFHAILRIVSGKLRQHMEAVMPEYADRFDEIIACLQEMTSLRQAAEYVSDGTPLGDGVAQVCRSEPAMMLVQYVSDARYIDNAVEAIHKLAETCKPYDVFICHKRTHEGGGVTEESEQANKLYELLRRKGYRVFYAPESIKKDAAGTVYEASIYHAIQTSRVMLVMCSKPEYLMSTMVRSEWHRYMERINRGEDKHILQLLYGMKPKDIPDELNPYHKFETLTASDIGFEENLLNAIRRYVPAKPWRKAVALAIAVVVLAGAAVVFFQAGQEKPAEPTPPPAIAATAAPAVMLGDNGQRAVRAINALYRLNYLDSIPAAFDYNCINAFMDFCACNGLPATSYVSEEAYVALISYDAIPKPTKEPTPTPVATPVPAVKTNVSGDGAARTITVDASGAWQASSGEDWIILGQTSGTGKSTVEVSLLPNPSTTTARTGSVTFTCGIVTNTVTITQPRADTVTAHVSETGDVRTITVEANGVWSVTTEASWIVPGKQRGYGDDSFTVTLEENPSTASSREGRVTFTCGTAEYAVTITQPKKGSVTAVVNGSGIEVTANGAWSAESQASWITLKTTGGTGNGTVQFELAENPSTTSSREGRVTFTCGTATYTVEITQDKADSISATVEGTGDTRTIRVTASGTWQVSTEEGWIGLGRRSGVGNHKVTLFLEPNTSDADRTGTVTFTCGTAECTVTITQPKKDSVTAVVNGSGIEVTANGAWSAESQASWITLKTTGGTGNGTVQFELAENPSTTSSREGSVIFTCGTAEYTVTITQPRKDSVTARAIGNVIQVTANGSWTAIPENAWIMLKMTNGTGNGMVQFELAKNPSTTSSREGKVTFICGEATYTVTITQARADSITAKTIDSHTIRVTANGPWRVSTEAAWIELAQTSGNGNADLGITVSPNTTSSDRTGDIVFVCGTAEHVLRIKQSGGYHIETEVSGTGNSRIIRVTANDAWSADAGSADWIILRQTSGDGNATVSVALKPNPSTINERTGMITFRCGDETSVVTITQPRQDSVSVSMPQSWPVSGAGENRSIFVTANGAWSAETTVPWIVLGKSSGNGDGTVSVTVQPNPSTTQTRMGGITFTCGTATCTVEITQEKVDSISATVEGTGDTRTIRVTANGTWQVSTEEDWIGLGRRSGVRNIAVTLFLEPNTSNADRTGTVTFTCGTASCSVTITQPRSATPFNVMLAAPAKNRLSRQNSVPVYSGPGTNYYRAANAKAECTVYEDFYVWGYENGWYMITYETNGGGNRTGYIQKGKFTGTISAEVLEFAYKAARTTGQVALTDDPYGLRETIFTLKAGTNVTYLATYEDDGRTWYYIECTVNGKQTRGFIPAGTLELR